MITTEYKGFEIVWAHNMDCWSCAALNLDNVSLNGIKRQIDTLDRKDRQAAKVQALFIGGSGVEAVGCEIVAYLGGSDVYGERVAVMKPGVMGGRYRPFKRAPPPRCTGHAGSAQTSWRGSRISACREESTRPFQRHCGPHPAPDLGRHCGAGGTEKARERRVSQRRRGREVIALIEAEWAGAYDLDTTPGGHYRITLKLRDRIRKVFVGGSPSDVRAQKNMRRDIRRAVREIQENA